MPLKFKTPNLNFTCFRRNTCIVIRQREGIQNIENMPLFRSSAGLIMAHVAHLRQGLLG